MFCERHFKNFCSEDISFIENYEKAISSKEIYDIHHRKEDEGYSKKYLIDNGLYYNRPACELIFLTHAEHASRHHKGRKRSKETCERISAGKKKAMNDETRRKIGLGRKGAHATPETIKKLSESHKGKHWYKDEKSGKRVYY